MDILNILKEIEKDKDFLNAFDNQINYLYGYAIRCCVWMTIEEGNFYREQALEQIPNSTKQFACSFSRDSLYSLADRLWNFAQIINPTRE